MEDTKDIDIDALVRKIYVVSPNLPQSEDFRKQMRAKLEEQIKDKIPKVELEQLDLSYIILNVKKTLSDFQNRIENSVAQQQLRRTTRVRKVNPDYQDSPLIQSLKNSSHGKKIDTPTPVPVSEPSTSPKIDQKTDCSTININTQSTEGELGGLVQVESLPVSASTNLVTIVIPSILQEKLQSVKYKISIDLNRLDLTKKILDLNVSHLESDIKKNCTSVADVIDGIQRNECKLTYEIKDRDNLQLIDETQTAVNNIPRIEVTTPLHESEARASASVSIIHDKEADISAKNKQRGPKRKYPKVLNTNEPPKKRGRKPGSKNKSKQEKSELAKYVEMFECNANSPSSAVSQIVTSTTQNWEILPDQTAQIAYFMNGAWTTLNAPPPNNGTNTLVTTTNLEDAADNDNFIPFDDFVNFIDNPSLDIGNNVIAQVLGDTEPLNSQQQNNSKLCPLSIDPPKNDVNPQTNQYELPRQTNAARITQSPASRQDTTTVGINSSNDINLNSTATEENNNNVIFSTCRSMPSLDIDDDLFCSTPDRSDNIVTFSMNCNETTTSDQNQSAIQAQEDTLTSDSAIDLDKRDILQSSSTSPENKMFSKLMAMPSNVKDKSEVIKEMSLLEIEKDFDDSLLDFNNCLDDDLLSLAPSSCFNSPIDDRFANSTCLNSGEPKINSDIDINTSENVPAPRSVLETGLIRSFDEEINPALKSFKIPKVKIVRDKIISHSFHAQEKPTTTDTDLPPSISKETKDKPQSAIRINQSPNTVIVSPTKPQSHGTSSDMETTNGHLMSIVEISKLFGSLCSMFLADMCFESTCKFSHELLDIGIVSISLGLLRNEVLISAYKFIWRNYKLFKYYFPIFCEEYGRRNKRLKLLTMVRDCELQPKCISFLKHVHKSLLGCGLSKVNACRMILNRVKDKSQSTIDVLLEMIIESDAHMFASAIEQFSNVNGYKFSMKQINELATVCLRSGSAELVPALIKCLIDVDQTDFLTMRSPELIQLLEMIKSGGGV